MEDTKNSIDNKLLREKCGYCAKELLIEKEFNERVAESKKEDKEMLNKDYNGVYVSPLGYFYCTPDCFRRFTED